MPILLDNPFNPGDLDPDHAAYTHAKILKMVAFLENNQISIQVALGTMADGVFVKGVIPAKTIPICDQEEVSHEALSDPEDPNSELQTVITQEATTEYTDLVAKTTAQAGERYYDGLAKNLYDWLQNYSATYAGTLE